MFRKYLRLNFVLAALAALAYTGDEETANRDAMHTGGGAGAAIGKSTPTDFTAFCLWVNRHVKAGNFTVNYDGRALKVDELLLDGKLRLLDGGDSIYAPFEGEIIDQLLPQIV